MVLHTVFLLIKMPATSTCLPSWAPSLRLFLPSRCLTCYSHGLEYQCSSYPSPCSSTKFYLIHPNGQNLHSTSASQICRAKNIPYRADDVCVCAIQPQAFRPQDLLTERDKVIQTADLTNIPHSLLVRPMQIGESEPWDCLVRSLDSVFRFAGHCSTSRN